MHKELKFAYGLLIVVAAHSVFSQIGFHGVADKLIEENLKLKREVNENAFVAAYLIDVINRHDVPIDEFDMIALNNPMRPA
jgi:hypothetical protein